MLLVAAERRSFRLFPTVWPHTHRPTPLRVRSNLLSVFPSLRPCPSATRYWAAAGMAARSCSARLSSGTSLLPASWSTRSSVRARRPLCGASWRVQSSRSCGGTRTSEMLEAARSNRARGGGGRVERRWSTQRAHNAHQRGCPSRPRSLPCPPCQTAPVASLAPSRSHRGARRSRGGAAR